jgi:molybdopterin synthase catalytic subunit
MAGDYIEIQTQDFDLSQEYQRLLEEADNPGAIVTFTGLVREMYPQKNIEPQAEELFLEHYPVMTEKCLRDIVNEAKQRWQITASRVIHRVGALSPGDQIVLVATASAHRQDAFEAAQFIMDYLKTKAPFWKRQRDKQGSHWVEQRRSDDEATNRWKK